MSTLEARQLTCRRQDRIVFQDVNFTIQTGEILHLKGCNGAGKTSLLKIMAGFIPALQGELRWQGDELPSDHSFFIGCKSGMKPFLTVRENLNFWAAIYQSSPEKIKEALVFLDMTPLENVCLGTLSKGQIQRVNLMRLLLVSKPIWLLDEPLTGLDQTAQHLFKQLVDRHLKEGGVVVWAAHHEDVFVGPALNLEDYHPSFSYEPELSERVWA